ncbi:hypothetical protein, partial [Paenibacillus endophyticus]|uniref:hypothetical protein n=1 Tax=Paenibacillus endophyticus TaxID=1294268 RepID=UPI0039F03069
QSPLPDTVTITVLQSITITTHRSATNHHYQHFHLTLHYCFQLIPLPISSSSIPNVSYRANACNSIDKQLVICNNYK